MSTYRAGEVTVSVELGPLHKLRGELGSKAHQILDKTAFDIQASGQGNAPVDTGALRASGYASGMHGGKSDYSQARSEAGSRRETEFTPEEQPANPFERVIGFSVIYALIVELTQIAFLKMAVERHRQAFVKAWKGLFTGR